MISKTRNYIKAIFITATAISCLMTSLLFYQFGSNIMAGILFIIIGLCIQFYQILCLLNWQNSTLRKKKDYFAFAKYMIITFTSCLASLAFGLNQIDRTIAGQSGALVEIEGIKKEISILSSRYSSDGIKKQINTLQSQIPKLTYNISERSININNEINKLKNKIDPTIAILNNKKITALSMDLADLERSSIDIKGAFQKLSELFGLSLNVTLSVFLLFVTVILEMMIYSTSQGGVKLFGEVEKKPAKKKIHNDDQLLFKRVS